MSNAGANLDSTKLLRYLLHDRGFPAIQLRAVHRKPLDRPSEQLARQLSIASTRLACTCALSSADKVVHFDGLNLDPLRQIAAKMGKSGRKCSKKAASDVQT